jgi:hypothetical protein
MLGWRSRVSRGGRRARATFATFDLASFENAYPPMFLVNLDDAG